VTVTVGISAGITVGITKITSIDITKITQAGRVRPRPPRMGPDLLAPGGRSGQAVAAA
jgi:hypothetical protein